MASDLTRFILAQAIENLIPVMQDNADRLRGFLTEVMHQISLRIQQVVDSRVADHGRNQAIHAAVTALATQIDSGSDTIQDLKNQVQSLVQALQDTSTRNQNQLDAIINRLDSQEETIQAIKTELLTRCSQIESNLQGRMTRLENPIASIRTVVESSFPKESVSPRKSTSSKKSTTPRKKKRKTSDTPTAAPVEPDVVSIDEDNPVESTRDDSGEAANALLSLSGEPRTPVLKRHTYVLSKAYKHVKQILGPTSPLHPLVPISNLNFLPYILQPLWVKISDYQLWSYKSHLPSHLVAAATCHTRTDAPYQVFLTKISYQHEDHGPSDLTRVDESRYPVSTCQTATLHPLGKNGIVIFRVGQYAVGGSKERSSFGSYFGLAHIQHLSQRFGRVMGFDNQMLTQRQFWEINVGGLPNQTGEELITITTTGFRTTATVDPDEFFDKLLEASKAADDLTVKDPGIHFIVPALNKAPAGTHCLLHFYVRRNSVHELEDLNKLTAVLPTHRYSDVIQRHVNTLTMMENPDYPGGLVVFNVSRTF